MEDADAGSHPSAEWERHVSRLWSMLDETDPAAFLTEMRALADERPPGDAAAFFELASAHDSTGQPDLAVPLYRQALAAGLFGIRRRRATIQLASSLRNLGEITESLALLEAERMAGSDELDDAVAAFLALTLADAGRERHALSLALSALAKHLPRYNRSLGNYAKTLVEK